MMRIASHLYAYPEFMYYPDENENRVVSCCIRDD